ncbi:hypothetical protein RvVAR0630_04480 [Agrobacterium vitis]|nr:hypothetical protein RvVAR0630_04480 [Agrobacterium vitis]
MAGGVEAGFSGAGAGNCWAVAEERALTQMIAIVPHHIALAARGPDAKEWDVIALLIVPLHVCPAAVFIGCGKGSLFPDAFRISQATNQTNRFALGRKGQVFQ